MTTTINTMAELEALAPNTQVTANDRRWTVVADGLQFGQGVVPREAFQSYLGSIMVGVPIEEGQFRYDGSRYHYYVGLRDNREWLVARFRQRSGEAMLVDTTIMTDVPGDVVDQPTWLPPALRSAAHEALVWRSRSLTYQRMYSEEQRRRVAETEAMRGRIQASLLQYAENNEISAHSDLGEAMAFAGLQRPPAAQETVNVRVEVSGAAEVDPSVVSLPAGSSLTMGTVNWARTIEVPVEVDEGECACGEVTETMVAEVWNRLNPGVEYDHSEIVDCPNC